MARKLCSQEEITFQQIYDQLDLKSQIRSELMQLEEQTELKYCQANYILKEIYDQCLAEGKIVVITSDMYLPHEIIVRILDKCGYKGYKKLYLSSEIGLKKHTGNLFDYLIQDLGEPAKKIVHIGDSKRNDNLIPRLKGIKTLYVDRQYLSTNFLNKRDVFQVGNTLFPFLNNTLFKYYKESDLFRWGYEALGPLLLGFTTWVHEQIIENGIDKVFFLARDMYLVIEIYRKLYGSKNVEYLEVSRKSLRAAYVKKENNIAAVFDTMTRRNYTIGDVLDALDIDDYTLDGDIDLSAQLSRKNVLCKEFAKLNEVIMDLLNSRKDFTEEYLMQMGVAANEKIAIIDIGWHATIQNMLENLIRKPLLGLYFGNTVRNNYREMATHGYWFSFDDESMASPFLSMTFILEVMLFPSAGTTTGYVSKGKKVFPLHASCEMQNFEQIGQLQRGAMTFVDDFIESGLSIQQIKCDEATKSFCKFAFEPTLIQAKTFANIPFEDGKRFNLASSQSFWHYLFHPICLFRDYKAARWKEGFIKQVLPLIKTPHYIVILGEKVKQIKLLMTSRR